MLRACVVTLPLCLISACSDDPPSILAGDLDEMGDVGKADCVGNGWSALSISAALDDVTIDRAGVTHAIARIEDGSDEHRYHVTNRGGSFHAVELPLIDGCWRAQVDGVEGRAQVACTSSESPWVTVSSSSSPALPPLGMITLTEDGAGDWQPSVVHDPSPDCETCAPPSLGLQASTVDRSGTPWLAYVRAVNGLGRYYVAVPNGAGGWRRSEIHRYWTLENGSTDPTMSRSSVPRHSAAAPRPEGGIALALEGTYNRSWNRFVALGLVAPSGAVQYINVDHGINDRAPEDIHDVDVATAPGTTWLTYVDQSRYDSVDRNYVKVARVRNGIAETAHIGGWIPSQTGLGTPVQRPATEGTGTSIAVDASGRPHLAYIGRDANGSWALMHAVLAGNDLARWQVERVAAFAGGNADLEQPETWIAIAPGGAITIGWTHRDRASLVRQRCR